jgi:hypothetical protein
MWDSLSQNKRGGEEFAIFELRFAIENALADLFAITAGHGSEACKAGPAA